MEFLNTFSTYLSFPFVRYAFITGVLIALSSSLLGVILVLKRFSFIGDGLSHTAFGAMAIATVLKLSNDSILTMPVTVLFAIFLLKTHKHSRLQGDSIIAIVSTGALAVGYMVVNIFSSSANISGDVCSTLFGSTSILTLTKSEVLVSAIASIAVILFFIFFYTRLFSVTFDPEFTTAIGKKTELYNMIIAIITAIVIVLAMNLVGSLLITALLIFPALSAMQVMKSFKSTIIYSAVLGVFASVVGLVVSIMASTPVGSTIVVVNIFLFFIHFLIGLKK